MRMPLLLLAVLLLLAPTDHQPVPIRFVPRVVDTRFAERSRLCEDGPASTMAPISNDLRRSTAAVLGPALRALQVHQLGDSLTEFPKVRQHLRTLLRARPRFLARYPTWAEATPFRNWGILGTVRYSGGRSGPLEVVGNHLCVADSAGVRWLLRLEAVDLWDTSD